MGWTSGNELFNAIIDRLDDTKGIDEEMLVNLVPDIANLFWEIADADDLESSRHYGRFFVYDETLDKYIEPYDTGWLE